MKKILIFLQILLASLTSYAQDARTVQALKNTINPSQINGVTQQLTIAQLRQLRLGPTDASTTYISNEKRKEGLWFVDKIDTSTPDDSVTCIVTQTGIRLKRKIDNHTPQIWGAIPDDNLDDTPAIQRAINYLAANGGGNLSIPKGVFFVRNLNVKKSVHLSGQGSAFTFFRFFRSSNQATDANTFAVRITGSYSSISDLTVDGYATDAYSIGNGIEIVPDVWGLQRKLNRVRVENFAGYKASRIGGSFGVNKNFARADISDGQSNHLLIGGNAIVVNNTTSFPAWELEMNSVNIYGCDGEGLNLGPASDSKFHNIYIGACVNRGLVLENDNKNNQFSNCKVYLCRLLNPNDSFVQKLDLIAPHEISLSTEYQAAVVITGANNQFKNFEVQENGSHGIMLGTTKYTANNCSIDCYVDGNGGYDKNESSTVRADYRRFGIILRNYYQIKITGIADDFRAKFLLGRQQRGFHVISSRQQATYLQVDNWYRIGNVDGGANYSPIIQGQTGKSNTVGTIFQLRSNYNQVIPNYTSSSSSFLEAPNDFLNVDMLILNQYEQDSEGGLGYSLGPDGRSGTIKINGQIITPSISSNTFISKEINVQTDSDSPNGLEIKGVGSNSARLFFSSPDNQSGSFAIRKTTNTLAFAYNARVGVTSGTTCFLFSQTGDFLPAVDTVYTIGNSTNRLKNAYINKVYTNNIYSPSGITLNLGTEGANSINILQGNILTVKYFGSGQIYFGSNGSYSNNGSKLQIDGDISFNYGKLKFLGSNSVSPAGNATLASGTVTISTSAATTSSIVYITTKTSSCSGCTAIPRYNYTTSSGSIVITAKKLDGSTESGCADTVSYFIIN